MNVEFTVDYKITSVNNAACETATQNLQKIVPSAIGISGFLKIKKGLNNMLRPFEALGGSDEIRALTCIKLVFSPKHIVQQYSSETLESTNSLSHN